MYPNVANETCVNNSPNVPADFIYTVLGIFVTTAKQTNHLSKQICYLLIMIARTKEWLTI